MDTSPAISAQHWEGACQRQGVSNACQREVPGVEGVLEELGLLVQFYVCATCSTYIYVYVCDVSALSCAYLAFLLQALAHGDVLVDAQDVSGNGAAKALGHVGVDGADEAASAEARGQTEGVNLQGQKRGGFGPVSKVK
jgi:hypothetical protein